VRLPPLRTAYDQALHPGRRHHHRRPLGAFPNPIKANRRSHRPPKKKRKAAMIRCVRMWTGEDGDSLFEEGWIDLAEGMRGGQCATPAAFSLSRRHEEGLKN
jgi:hypothetical protein